jgi:hypothetical protein
MPIGRCCSKIRKQQQQQQQQKFNEENLSAQLAEDEEKEIRSPEGSPKRMLVSKYYPRCTNLTPGNLDAVHRTGTSLLYSCYLD